MKGTPDWIKVLVIKAETVLQKLLMRHLNEDDSGVKTLLERSGINEVKQLLLDTRAYVNGRNFRARPKGAGLM